VTRLASLPTRPRRRCDRQEPQLNEAFEAKSDGDALSKGPLWIIRFFAMDKLTDCRILLFASSLLCVGNGKIELSGNEVDDGDQIPG
jgi:hypothetical protein